MRISNLTISVTINAVDVADLRRQLASLLGDGSATIVYGGAPDPQPSPPKASAQRAAPKAATPPSDPSPEPSDTSPTIQSEATTIEADGGADTASPSEGDPRTLSYDDDIKPAVLKVSAKHGRPGVEKLLAKFGAGNAREVPEDRWPEFMAEIEALLT